MAGGLQRICSRTYSPAFPPYQEKKKSLPLARNDANTFHYRERRSTPSTASAKRVTKARASFRAPLLRSHRCAGWPTGNNLISTQDGAHPSQLNVVLIRNSFHSHAQHVYASEDGPPVRAAVDCSLILSFLASIRKCVYSVLCYNQCISFVAIERMCSRLYLSLYCTLCCRYPRCAVKALAPTWRGLRSDSEPTRECGESLFERDTVLQSSNLHTPRGCVANASVL